MSRLAQTWIPHNIQAQYTGTSGMAYTTMVPGYDQDRAEMMATVGIPNIQISAEQGDKHWPVPSDILRLGREAIVGPRVIADLAIQRKLLSLRGTASLNPNFLLASTIGAGPALLSGETGELVKMLPDDTRGFANGYLRDELFDQANWEEGLRRYPNMYLNMVDKAVHAHLLSIRGLLRQLGRFERLAQESREHGMNLEVYDVHRIAGRTSEQFSAQKEILQPAA